MSKPADNKENSQVSLTASKIELALATSSKRRDKLYIIAEILELAKEGTLKTQIMYRANLSFTQLNAYLDFMLKINFLEKQQFHDKDVYVASEKGIDFLDRYHEITELLGSDYINLYNIGKKTFVRK